MALLHEIVLFKAQLSREDICFGEDPPKNHPNFKNIMKARIFFETGANLNWIRTPK